MTVGVGIIFTLVILIIITIRASSKINSREYDEIEASRLAQEQLEGRTILLVYHYARRLVDNAISSLSIDGDEVIVNLGDSFLIRGKNIFEPSRQEITIRRLRDSMSKDEFRPQVFFRIEGDHIRSHICVPDTFELFIGECLQNAALKNLGNTKDYVYIPTNIRAAHPNADLDSIDQEILKMALGLCSSCPMVDETGMRRYSGCIISIEVRDPGYELPYQIELGFPPSVQVDIYHHQGDYDRKKLVYRHRFTHNLYLEVDDEWLNALAEDYNSRK